MVNVLVFTNLANVSEENGDPLSVVSLLLGPYWELSGLIFFVIGSAACDEIFFYKYGYLLTVSTIGRYSVLLW